MAFNRHDPITKITDSIIGAAIEVHRVLGPGLLESAYQACLEYELFQRGVKFTRQVPVPVIYRTVKVDCAYRLDFLVADRVIVEIKSVERLAPIHTAQLIAYLKLTGCPVGLLINFNETILHRGVRRKENPNLKLGAFRERTGGTNETQIT